MSLNIEHINYQLIIKLKKILKNFTIKNKLFNVVIDNVNNNDILKDEFKKTINHHKFQ